MYDHGQDKISHETEQDGPGEVSINHLTTRGFNHFTVRHNQQLEVTQYSGKEEQLPPLSKLLKYDDKLKLKRGEEELTPKVIKEKLLKGVETPLVKEMLKLDAYPNNYVLAQFALRAYEKDCVKLIEGLPNASGWELLVTASSAASINNYYGVAYWNPKQQQVVIAHKGTIITSFSDLLADINGILLNRHTSQINSATTFAEIIRSILHELNSDHNISLQLSFTGHSLGGWLAQITTFTVRYLKKTEADKDNSIRFLKSKEPESCYHAHTVVFDSPGCKKMLLKMESKFDVRLSGHSISLNGLDITSYLSAPNLINACNEHVGIVNRIFVLPLGAKEVVEEKIEEKKSIHQFFTKVYSTMKKAKDNLVDLMEKYTVLHTIQTHSMEKIKEVFDPLVNTAIDKRYKEPREVIDWPATGKEYYAFFGFAKKENDFHLDPNDMHKSLEHCSIRYQTEPIDKRTHSISVFTQKEQQFLEIWERLERRKRLLTEKLLIQDEYDKEKLLNKFSIIEKKNGKKVILFDSLEHPASRFINYAKQLFRWYPGVFEKMKIQISKSPEDYEEIYSMKSKDYITLYLKSEFRQNQLYFKDDSVKLKDFLVSDEYRVLHLATKGDTKLEASRVYNIFNQIKTKKELEFYTDDEHYTFLNLWHLLSLRPHLDVEGIFESEKSNIDNLLVIESQEKISEAIDLFKGLFNKLEATPPHKKHKKIIIITPQEGGFYEDVKSIYYSKDKFLGEKVRYTLIDCIQFSSLTSESQKELLKTKVYFQGQEEQLMQLINPDTLSSEELGAFNAMIDLDTFIKLLKNKKDEPIVIGSIPTLLSKIEVAYTKIGKCISEKDLVDALLAKPAIHKTPPPLFMISIDQEDNNVAKDELVKRLEITVKKRIDINKENIVVTGQDKESEFQQLCHDNSENIIHWIKLEKDGFIWKQLYDPHFYVKRNFNQIVIKKNIKDILLKENTSDLFVFSGLEQLALSELLRIKEEEKRFFNQNIENKDIVVIKTSEKHAEAAFDEAKTKEEKEKPVHWIKVEDNKDNENEKLLIWRRSHGSLGEINKYIDNTKQIPPLKEEEFSKVSDKAVIIVGEPGMGKSTTLTSLSKYKLESSWVIRIDLRDCQEAMKQLPSQLSASEEVIKFLSKVKDTGLDNPLAQRLVQYKLEKETYRPLLILFDGFDEIKEESQKNENEKKLQEKVIRLLKFLKDKTHAHLWVTTRKQYKKNLEEGLSAFATTFEPVSPRERENFLQEFWLARFTLLSQDYKTEIHEKNSGLFTRELLRKAESILGESSSFMGIPLQLRMLAEVFQSEFETIVKSNGYNMPNIDNIPNFEFHDIKDLYLRFIDLKYEIYFKEKTGLAAGFSGVSKEWFTELLTKMHRRLAFKELFNDEQTKKFLGAKSPLYLDEQEKLEPNKKQIEELYRVGLLQYTSSKGQVEFIHKTFAEYFTADLLISWLTKPAGRHPKYPSLEEFLLTRILIKSNHNIVRLFLNSQLIVNQLSNWALFRQFGKRLAELWSNKQEHFFNEMHQTALHIAVQEDHTNIIGFLLGGFKANPEGLISLISARDRNGKTALYIAAEKNNNEVVKQFLDSIDIVGLDTVKQRLLLATVFRMASDEKNEVVVSLLEEAKKCSYLKKQIDSIQEKWKLINPFLKAVLDGNWEAVSEQLRAADDNYTPNYLILVIDDKHKTALHLATENGHDTMVRQLLDFVQANLPETLQALVVATDDYGQTALHSSAENDHVEVMQQLLNFIKENFPETLKTLMVATIRWHKQTALHRAAENGHDRVVRQLLDFVQVNLPETLQALVVATDDYGQTALHSAAENGHVKVMQQLLNFVKANIPETLKTLVVATFGWQEQTALHLAAENGHGEVVQQLLNFVKVNLPETFKTLVVATVGSEKQTALHLAAENGHSEVVQRLLDVVQANLPKVLKALVLAKDKDSHTALHLAANQGRVEVVEKLLGVVQVNLPKALNALVVATNKDGGTVLHLAAEKNYSDVVKKLLESVKAYPETFQALVVATDRGKQTALHLAASIGAVEVVEILLDFVQANLSYETQKILVVGTVDLNKQTALHRAAEKGCVEVVEKLLDFVQANLPKTLKTLVVETNESGHQTILHLAAENGHVEVVEKLLDFVQANLPKTLKALVMAPKKWRQQTALHCAAEKGCVEIVEKLLDFVQANLPKTLKTLVMSTDDCGETALHRAAEKGHVAVVKKLLSFIQANLPNALKALVVAINKHGQTALHLAAEKGHGKVVEELLDFAEINLSEVRDSLVFFKTQVEFLTGASRGDVQTVERLLDSVKNAPDTFKSLVVAINKHGQTALHLAAQNGHGEVVEKLLDFAEINLPEVRDSLIFFKTQVELLKGASRGDVQTVERLLESVKNTPDTLKTLVEATDKDGRTALHLAAWRGRVEVVKHLLNFIGANLTETLHTLVVVTDEFGQTALHLAAWCGRVEVVKQLLNFVGANLPETLHALVKATDVYGETALNLVAQEKKHWNIVISLLNSGADINDLNDNQCCLLKNYVLNSNYENKKQILKLIEEH